MDQCKPLRQGGRRLLPRQEAVLHLQGGAWRGVWGVWGLAGGLGSGGLGSGVWGSGGLGSGVWTHTYKAVQVDSANAWYIHILVRCKLTQRKPGTSIYYTCGAS